MLNYKKIVNGEFLPYVLYIHGWGGALSSLIPLSKGLNNFNHLFIDLPGCGESLLDKEYTLSDYLEGIEEVLSYEKIDYFIGVGHSFGGKLLAYLALRNSKLKKLILIAPSIYSPLITRGRIKTFFNKITYLLFKKRMFSPSRDYLQASKKMKNTFKNVYNKFLSKKELKKINCKTIIIGFLNDKEVPFYRLKIAKKYMKATLYKKRGNHFSFYSYMHFIKGLIDE